MAPLRRHDMSQTINHEGSKWTISGDAVDGPRTGESPTEAASFMAYRFTWAAFYPKLKVYSN